MKTDSITCPTCAAYQALFPLGEVLDRLSIALLKLEQLPELTKEQQDVLLQQVMAGGLLLFQQAVTQPPTAGLLGELSLRLIALFHYLGELLQSNRKQWQFENQVRAEQTADAAVKARQQNTIRTALKDQINALVQQAREIKDYPPISS